MGGRCTICCCKIRIQCGIVYIYGGVFFFVDRLLYSRSDERFLEFLGREDVVSDLLRTPSSTIAPFHTLPLPENAAGHLGCTVTSDTLATTFHSLTTWAFEKFWHNLGQFCVHFPRSGCQKPFSRESCLFYRRDPQTSNRVIAQFGLS
ncbi:hypothetical protein K440DRAFT_386780 [Wilcoxina mikolae CBS 423.85]|nr:hypothetical protein K440DRAFT_386780 [Wilcoxina mikolae CBS 423.85]